MSKKSKNMLYLVITQALLWILLFFIIVAKAEEEPNISIYQGTEKGTSVLVVEWPDGIRERLLYKDHTITVKDNTYIRWFNDRYDAYEKRRGLNE